jgi:glycopeptide antibiotics resistance protein
VLDCVCEGVFHKESGFVSTVIGVFVFPGCTFDVVRDMFAVIPFGFFLVVLTEGFVALTEGLAVSLSC